LGNDVKWWAILVSNVLWLVLVGGVLFSSAGRFDILPFWEYLGGFAGLGLLSIPFVDPGLLKERMRPGGRRLDARYLLLLGLVVVHWSVAGMDLGRYHWAPPIPTGLQLAGLAAFVLSFAGITWTMHVNRFFSTVVRIQTDRGHELVTAGPYRGVRHPGYAFALVGGLSSGVALGSWLSALFAVIFLPLLFYRTVTEDAFLKKHLPGYGEYARRVPYRMIPGIW